MPPVSNPFVAYLNRYTTASPDHEAAFDEFLAQATPPAAGPLQLHAKVERFLQACFTHPNPPSVILTGNAGDGKTYLCRKVAAEFGQKAIDDWDTLAKQPLRRDGIDLYIVKDLSELSESQGAAVLQRLATSLQNEQSTQRYLIAANEGRLRSLLSQPDLISLSQRINQQLHGRPEADSSDIIVINLTQVSTSSFVPVVLGWMTDERHWSACAPCPIRERCPILHNARHLRATYIVERVQLLYQLLEHLDIHVTVRDMLIHLSYSLAGNLACADLQRTAEHHDCSRLVYYENIWGRENDSAFRRKASVLQHLERLRIGLHSLFEIDDFIVSGADRQEWAAEHTQLFVPAVDLHGRQFEQDRKAYVEGGAEHEAGKEARAMLEWLPHCRRKLFFEWPKPQHMNQLIAFQYYETYRQLLRQERSGQNEDIRQLLVLGLNRAFSRLYLTDSTTLYVTSQYLHSAEQSRPLVRLSIPVSAIILHVDHEREQRFDCVWPNLYLRIGAPPELLHHDPSAAARPQQWRLNLLLFEYLMRLAHGGTYNVLAEECELSVRNLKDSLLSAFGRDTNHKDRVEFFVAERRQYTLKRLSIDEQGRIRPGG